MSLSRTIARPLLASVFVVGPIYALRNSSKTADTARPVTDPLVQLAQRLGVPLPEDPETLVKINAGVQIAAGVALATGKFPRLSAAVLATSLIPTTAAGHAFWNESDPAARRAQQIHLAKNLSLLGGLIIAAGDTDGKPGVTWLAKHAAGDAKRQLGHAAATAKLEGKVAALETEVGAASLGSALLAAGQHAKGAIAEKAHQAATSDTTQHLADRASELAGNLADTAREKGPVVAAAAREHAASFADTARQTAKEKGPVVAAAAREHAAALSESAREQAGPVVKDLRKQAKANAKELRKQAKKSAKSARKQAGPVVKDLRKQAKKKAKKTRKQAGKKAPAVAAAARDQAAAVGQAARAKIA